MGILNQTYKKIIAAKNGTKNEGCGRAVSICNVPSRVPVDDSERSSAFSMTMSEVSQCGERTNRWEKAAVATHAIVKDVIAFDPDGIDVVVVGGNDHHDSDVTRHHNITDSDRLESIIEQQQPGGSCFLGAAMEDVINQALERDLESKPCSVLVLTAGKPDDPELLEESLRKASKAIASRGWIQNCGLSITFIQIGTDPEVTEYLKKLDEEMHGTCDCSNETADIVDMMDYGELQKMMQKMKDYNDKLEKEANQKTKTGAILGGLAGAAKGIRGKMLNKPKKSSKTIAAHNTWGGSWKCMVGDEIFGTLEVRDDGKGNLSIDGLRDETVEGRYSGGHGAWTIQVVEPFGETIVGKPNASLPTCVLDFNDETRWIKDVPETTSWIDKRFFRKVRGNEKCDYVVVLDRSAAMDPTNEAPVSLLAQ